MNTNQFYQDLLNNSIVNSDSLIVGILNLPNLDANSVTYIDSNNDLSDVILNNGQVLIGSNGNAPVANTLTGTTDQVNVTPGAGSITLSLPQSIAPTSSPTFNDITATSLNGTLVSNYIITPSTIDLDMNTHDISNVTNLNSLAVANIVTNTGSGTAGNIPSFVSSKVIQDSGISAASISGGPFLPLAGGIMNGDIGMGTHEISNLSAIRCRTDTRNFVAGNGAVVTSGIDSVVIGSSTILNGDNSVVIGDGARILGPRCVSLGHDAASTSEGIAIGFNSQSGNGISIGKNATTGISASCVTLGHQASCAGLGGTSVGWSSSAGGNSSVAVGISSSATQANTIALGGSASATANGALAIGFSASSSGANSISIGTSATNSTANSCLIGDSSIANIRANSTSCDLGTSTSSFRSIYLNTGVIGTGALSMDSSGALTIGGTSATSLAIGRTGVITSFPGTTDSSSTSTGTITTAGGVGIAKKAYIGDSVFVNTTSATAKIVVSGGVQNEPGEDSCIRAISSTVAAKIEIQNTTASTGKVYELRSLSNGSFDITDRTGAATLFTINNNKNFGFNGTSFGGGVKVLFIANATTVPTSNPGAGGILYCEGGALKFRGSSGSVTTIAPA